MEKNKSPRKFILVLTAAVFVLTIAGCLYFALFHTQVTRMMYQRKYQEYVTYYAEKYDIDPRLLYSVIRTESNFNPKAESAAGARGLMQITEITFEWIRKNIAAEENLTFSDLFDPEVNIRFGSYFLKYCLLRYDDDVETAAAAYHSGWGTVDGLLSQSQYSANGKTLDEYPYPQMRQYVKKITESYNKYKTLYKD